MINLRLFQTRRLQTIVPLDVKIEIAKLFDEVWILLVLYDDEFKEFSYSDIGIALYKKLIMDKIEPLIDYAGTQRWYYHYQLHRNGDLPAVIWDNGTKE